MTFYQQGEIRDAERRVLRKDGSTIEVSLNASAVRDPQGRMLYSRSSWRDISERKRLNRELRARELLRVFLDAAPVMMWMTDENCQAQMCNGEWLRFTGRSLQEELAVPWSGADNPSRRPRRLPVDL